MSVDELSLMRRTVPREGFNDLDLVVLTADVVADDGQTVKAGTHGTVVGLWENGQEVEVEFSDPDALATVPTSALRMESAAR